MILVQIGLYLIGFILSYVLIKIFRENRDLNDWSDVIFTIILSLFSWLMVGLIMIIVTIRGTFRFFKNLSKQNPPSWM